MLRDQDKSFVENTLLAMQEADLFEAIVVKNGKPMRQYLLTSIKNRWNRGFYAKKYLTKTPTKFRSLVHNEIRLFVRVE